MSDRRLAAVARRCQDLPGHELFQYLDEDGQRQAIGSADVNDYVREIAGRGVHRQGLPAPGAARFSPPSRWRPRTRRRASAKRRLTAAVVAVAARLGNTPTICRKCYIHPDVVAAHVDGSLEIELNGRDPGGLSADEAAVLNLLRTACVAKA